MPKLDEKGITPFLLLVIIGIVIIIVIGSTFSFKNKVFKDLFPKPLSQAVTPETLDILPYFMSTNTDKRLTDGAGDYTSNLVQGNSMFRIWLHPANWWNFTWDDNWIYSKHDHMLLGSQGASSLWGPGYRYPRRMNLGDIIRTPISQVQIYNPSCQPVDSYADSQSGPNSLLISLYKHIPDFDFGGDLGRQDTIIIKFLQGSSSELEYYAKGWGFVRWQQCKEPMTNDVCIDPSTNAIGRTSPVYISPLPPIKPDTNLSCVLEYKGHPQNQLHHSDFFTDTYYNTYKSNIAVYERGFWYTYSHSAPEWGRDGDIPVSGDYENNGRSNFAIWRPSNGEWWILSQDQNSHQVIKLGQDGDLPVPGDYDGDGKMEPAIFRKGIWYIPTIYPTGVIFGGDYQNEIPVPADYDGDGKTDRAIYQPTTGDWLIAYLSGVQRTHYSGPANAIPVPGDYNGDGKVEPALYVSTTSTWLISTIAPSGIVWGEPNNIPVPADYNGDGTTNIAVWNGVTKTWKVKNWDNFGQLDVTISGFGSSSVDIPVSTTQNVTNSFVLTSISSPSPSPVPNPTPKPGDINGDGVVNVIDYGIFVGDFPTQNLRSDIDHDGRVTVIDYGIFVGNFGH